MTSSYTYGNFSAILYTFLTTDTRYNYKQGIRKNTRYLHIRYDSKRQDRKTDSRTKTSFDAYHLSYEQFSFTVEKFKTVIQFHAGYNESANNEPFSLFRSLFASLALT